MGKKLTGAHYAAGLAAGAAALAVLSTPIGMIELVITSSGISEIIHAAAPPLGMTARLMIAGFAGTMTAGMTLAFKKKSNMADPAADGDEKMGFALSKLTAFARGRGRGVNDDVPVLRRADAHPDAPARRPIFASQDFGGVEIFRAAKAPLAVVPDPEPAPVAEAPAAESAISEAPVIESAAIAFPIIESPAAAFYLEDEREPIVDGAGLAMPASPEPLPDAEMLALAARRPVAVAPVEEAVVTAAPFHEAPVAEEMLTPAPTVEAHIAQAEAMIAPTLVPEDASIADLAARFEQGLARRIALDEAAKAVRHAETVMTRNGAAQHQHQTQQHQPRLADLPPAQPVRVRSDVDMEVEEALRAALGTLQKMTSRAG